MNYPINQCALYKMPTKSRLAKILGRSANFIAARAGDPTLYKVWDEPKSNGKFRTIEAPRDDLKAIQRRIATLLQRVLAPTYLYSPVKGKSYVDNAVQHRGAREIRLLDVVDYFGNCGFGAVHWFFKNDMKCSPDVAWLLASLATRNGHLPQGSPCSPILSFYSCYDMWQKIQALCAAEGCKLTVYVDDITVSGDFVPEKLIWGIKQVLHNHQHTHHRQKERRHVSRAAEVTGIILKAERMSVPHRHYKKLLDARTALLNTEDVDEKARLKSRAISLESQIQQLAARG